MRREATTKMNSRDAFEEYKSMIMCALSKRMCESGALEGGEDEDEIVVVHLDCAERGRTRGKEE